VGGAHPQKHAAQQANGADGQSGITPQGDVLSGDQWFLPVYEFEGYAKDFDLQNKDDVSVNANFVVLKDTFVDYTDYRFYAKLLRFLWRFTCLHRLVDIVSKWHSPGNKHLHRMAQPSVLSE
jgi:hypothetical protein